MNGNKHDNTLEGGISEVTKSTTTPTGVEEIQQNLAAVQLEDGPVLKSNATDSPGAQEASTETGGETSSGEEKQDGGSPAANGNASNNGGKNNRRRGNRNRQQGRRNNHQNNNNNRKGSQYHNHRQNHHMDDMNKNGVFPDGTYKTELCRSFEYNAYCAYGNGCQFAHGMGELQARHFDIKYKTQLCKNYHNQGECKFAARCKFIRTFFFLFHFILLFGGGWGMCVIDFRVYAVEVEWWSGGRFIWWR